MAITVPFDLSYEFEVKAPYATVFAELADVPKSAGHFPKLEKLVDPGGGSYRWEMEKSASPRPISKPFMPPTMFSTRKRFGRLDTGQRRRQRADRQLGHYRQEKIHQSGVEDQGRTERAIARFNERHHFPSGVVGKREAD